MTESLTAKRNSMLEKAREEYTFNKLWSQDGKMFFNKNANKVKTYYSFFFSVMSQTNYEEKEMCFFYCTFAEKFFIDFFFFFTSSHIFFIKFLTMHLVKIHCESILFSSALTKYFFFCKLCHYSITELSTSIKLINKISNYTII